jgi:hypothetical protein
MKFSSTVSKISLDEALNTIYNIPAPKDVAWVPLLEHDGYEIETTFPHRIRYQKRTKSGIRWVQRSMCDGGNNFISVCCKTGSATPERHHLLVMRQFVENPHNFTHIEHINKCNYDNNISNMRWCESITFERTYKRKTQKGVVQTYFDELPPFTELITDPRVKSNTFYKSPFEFYEYFNTGKECGYRIVSELCGRSKGYYFKSVEGRQLWIGSENALTL